MITALLVPSETAPTTSLSELVAPISGFVVGCPTRVIADTLRTMAIDLCQRSRVWVVDADAVAFTAGEYEYELTFPSEQFEPIDIASAVVVKADGSKVPLKHMTPSALRASRRSWPEADSGSPLVVTTTYPGHVQFAPVPDTSEQVQLRVTVRPTTDADVFPTWLSSEFQRELFHGTLHHLMMMPSRAWSNEKQSMYHGKQWTHLLSAAKWRAVTEYNTGALSVEMRPFA